MMSGPSDGTYEENLEGEETDDKKRDIAYTCNKHVRHYKGTRKTKRYMVWYGNDGNDEE
jgi:hypothetical protein